jgi:hypothetical protein
MEIIPDVCLKNNLEKHFVFNNTVASLHEKLNTIHDISKLRLDPELTLLVCNLVENTVGDNDKMKLDKKELVVLILAKVFTDLSDAEKESIKTQIQFLFNNGKIKKVKTSKKVWYYFKEWVKRRFL